MPTCDSVNHSQTCVADCSDGYNLTGGLAFLTCNSGALSGSLPSCEPLPCKYNEPSAVGIEHNCSNLTTGSTCEAGCTPVGFEYASEAKAELFRCEATGEFNGTLPSCQRKCCTDLTLESKFAHNCLNMTFEQNCAVSCGRGWTMLGAVSVFECGADGAITGELPQCVGQPCDAIPSVGPLNGEACDNLTTGMQCNVTCKPGYGPNFIRMTCDESNFFVDTIPLCEPAQCPQSPQLQDPSLAHDCEGVTFDQRCSVLCAAGYVLNGDAGEVWRCELSGPTLELTGTLPDCRPLACPNISSTAGMDSNCTNLVAGQSCQQTCVPGFLPVGGSSAIHFFCDLQGNTKILGSLECERIKCNTNIYTIPHVEQACASADGSPTVLQ